MSQGQEIVYYIHDESLESSSEIEDGEEAEFLEASEEVSAAEVISSSQDPEKVTVPSTAITATSLSKSDEFFSIQKEEASSSTLEPMPDADELPRDPIADKVALLVKFLLQKYHMKEVVTKEHMLNTVIRQYENHFPKIFSMASERLELVFGIDVIELFPDSQCYFLFNKLCITYDGVVSDDTNSPKTGLLIIILGVIFMKGSRTTEEEIWKVLNRMGIYADQNHFMYGDSRKFITEDLVKQEYLEFRKVPNSDPAHYDVLWGPKAHAEINKVKFLEFFAKINDSDTPTFSTQFKEALKDEEERINFIHGWPFSRSRACSKATSKSFSHHYRSLRDIVHFIFEAGSQCSK
ncbi:melanoma-associated antigen B16-like [Orycteropus afer afer]|uniref:Melanoma-associated antigen B16-like n=1 Tax=Orycteropus afer afer TaxID=1230840 RepID=A0A8B7B210_ORYAF|nr:melanoma-associated antigen B16-like [Orycteropus afer afer]